MADVKEEFEGYVADLSEEMKANRFTDVMGDDERRKIDDLIEQTRAKLEHTSSSAEARDIFARFKSDVERFGQGTGI